MADCRNCGAPMRIDPGRDVLVCDHCRSEHEPSTGLEPLELFDDTDLSCPACSARLVNGRLKGHQLICCKRCFGMLVDMNRFVVVIEAVRSGERPRRVPPRQQNPGERALDCPKCGRPMLGHLYGGPGNIVIDTCERCLVNWLDAGELRRIAAAADSR